MKTLKQIETEYIELDSFKVSTYLYVNDVLLQSLDLENITNADLHRLIFKLDDIIERAEGFKYKKSYTSEYVSEMNNILLTALSEHKMLLRYYFEKFNT